MELRKLVLILSAVLTSYATYAGTAEKINRIFDRLTGAPLLMSDPRRATVEALVAEGKLREAAAIATADERFYNTTIRHWVSSFSNRDQDPFFVLNDLAAMVIGEVRDDRDFREVLFGDFTYAADPLLVPTAPVPAAGDNNHYSFLETNRVNLFQTLRRVEPQRADLADAAGILTSRGWGLAHLSAGTNRRAIEYTFLEFTCRPLKQMNDPTMLDERVRRDVDRAPGGSSTTYVTSCRGCHAGMDTIGGAYAYYNFTNNQVTYNPPTVSGKMNQNGNVFANGWVTTDNFWKNLFVDNHNRDFGWRGPLEGNGVREFGQMIANSEAFSQCMAKRVFKHACQREPTASEEEKEIRSLAQSFEASGYKLRRLFEEAVTNPACLGY